MKPRLSLEKTAVIGAGLMGGQIGLVLALSSRETVLMSRSQESLDRTLENINRYAVDLHRHGNLGGASPSAVMQCSLENWRDSGREISVTFSQKGLAVL